MEKYNVDVDEAKNILILTSIKDIEKLEKNENLNLFELTEKEAKQLSDECINEISTKFNIAKEEAKNMQLIFLTREFYNTHAKDGFGGNKK